MKGFSHAQVTWVGAEQNDGKARNGLEGKPKGVQRINRGSYPPTGAEPMLDRKFEPFP